MFSRKKKKPLPQVASGFDEASMPTLGATILHCRHPEEPRHWHKLPSPVPFGRPDKTSGVAEFVSLCTACHDASGGDFRKMKIHGDSVWEGAPQAS